MRVLLTRLSSLGDIIHTWPLALALREVAPDVELYWLVEEHFRPLVEGHPAVHAAIGVATRRWRRAPFSRETRSEVARTVRVLKDLRCEAAVDPQGLCKSALWARLAGVPRRVGLHASQRRERLAGGFYTETVAPPTAARHVIDITISLAGALGRRAEPGAVPDGRFMLRQGTGPALPPGSVVLLPATGGPGKAWPPAHLAALAATLAQLGRPVTIAWGPGERPLAEEIACAAGAGVQVAPPTTITELAHLLATASLVVGGDTGTVHLAASLGVPTVAIFLATDPTRNGPRGRRIRVVSAARAGARRGRARTGPDGEVAPAAVLAATLELLS